MQKHIQKPAALYLKLFKLALAPAHDLLLELLVVVLHLGQPLLFARVMLPLLLVLDSRLLLLLSKVQLVILYSHRTISTCSFLSWPFSNSC